MQSIDSMWRQRKFHIRDFQNRRYRNVFSPLLLLEYLSL